MASRELSVLTYNIHKGFSPSGRGFTLEKIRQALHAESPDLVFLQEVLGAHRRHSQRIVNWPALPQLEFIAQDGWPFATYGQNSSSLHGHHGNGLLSRFEVREWRNDDVSTHRFERRGILHTKLDLPGSRKHLHAFCIHFGLTKRGREIQIGRLVTLLNERTEADDLVLVAGDFNDWTERASGRLIRESNLEEVFFGSSGKHALTFPSAYPLLKLDRIYFKNMSLHQARVLKGRPWNALSDHAPLAATFHY